MFGTFGGSAMVALSRAQECAADRGSSEIGAAEIVLAVLSRLGSSADRSLVALVSAVAARPELGAAGLPTAADPDQLDRLSRSAFTDRFPGQRLPFAGYPLLATLAWVDPIVRRDGQLSVGRSFRRAEWRAMLAEALPDTASECRIFRSFPYRLCVEHIR